MWQIGLPQIGKSPASSDGLEMGTDKTAPILFLVENIKKK
jgi:hypothetical protein